MRRTKAVGGGKTEPVAPYKKRKDVGQQRGSSAPAPGRSKGGTELKAGTAGTQGSAAMSTKERQRKAYLERKARERVHLNQRQHHKQSHKRNQKHKHLQITNHKKQVDILHLKENQFREKVRQSYLEL